MRGFGANALWELSFMGLKTFIVLFVVEGLGESVGTASAVMGVVAGGTPSPPSEPAGWPTPSESTGSCASPSGSTASGCWSAPGFLFGSFLIGLPLIALAGAVVMTLPYGILVGMTPPGPKAPSPACSDSPGARRRPRAPSSASPSTCSHPFSRPQRLRRHVDRIGAPILLSLPFLNAIRAEEPQVAEDAEPVVAALDDLALAA